MKKEKLMSLGVIALSSVILLAACGDEEKKESEEVVQTDKKEDVKTESNNESNQELKEDSNKIAKEEIIEDNKDLSNTEVIEEQADSLYNGTSMIIEPSSVLNYDSLSEKAVEDGLYITSTFYTSNEQADGLIDNKEDFKVESVETFGNDYVAYLLNKVISKELQPTKNIVLDKDEIILSFGDEIQLVQGSAGGDMFTQSILKTLFTNMPYINSIVFEYTDEDGNEFFVDHVLTNEKFTKSDVKY